MSTGTLMGVLACANCKNQYIKVELINLGRSLGIDHVDFFCAVCGQFVRHFDVSPHISDPDTEKLQDEVNEELNRPSTP